MPVLGYPQIEAFTGSLGELDKLIDWKATSVEVLKHYKIDTIRKGAHMQMQFTVELRVDFADRDKLPMLKQALLQAARHCYSSASLLTDTPKTTQIAVYCNDFFSPPEEILLMEDIIAKGLADTKTEEAGGEDEISAELAAAVTNG